MPLTCNAVGDVIAVIQLAIHIAEFLADYRDAPSECRALLQDLRSMEHLLASAQPTIHDIKDTALKDVVMERLRIVSRRVQDALDLVAKFRSAIDSSPADPNRKWRTAIVKFATKQSERVVWALKRSRNAEACRVAINQSMEPLTLALLLAFKADQASVMALIQESLDDLSNQIDSKSQHATVWQDSCSQEIALLTTSHDGLKKSLESAQRGLSAIKRHVSATHANTVYLRQDVAANHQAVIAYSAMTEGRLSQLDDNLRNLPAQLAARPAANPFDLLLNHVLSLPGYTLTVITSQPSEEDGALVTHSQMNDLIIRPVNTALVIAGLVPVCAIQLACAGATILAFFARMLYSFTKSPVVPRVIFVKGFGVDKYQISVAEARSPEELHRALRKELAGKIGSIFLIQRKYEVYKRGTSADQSNVWTGSPLHPGDKIELGAVVERFTSADGEPQEVVCLSCSCIIPTVNGPEPVDQPDGPRWMTCPRCSTVVQISSGVSVIDSPKATQKRRGNSDSEYDSDPANRMKNELQPEKARLSKPNDGNGEESSLSLEETLRHCRRVHLIFKYLENELASMIGTKDPVQSAQHAPSLGGNLGMPDLTANIIPPTPPPSSPAAEGGSYFTPAPGRRALSSGPIKMTPRVASLMRGPSPGLGIIAPTPQRAPPRGWSLYESVRPPSSSYSRNTGGPSAAQALREFHGVVQDAVQNAVIEAVEGIMSEPQHRNKKKKENRNFQDASGDVDLTITPASPDESSDSSSDDGWSTRTGNSTKRGVDEPGMRSPRHILRTPSRGSSPLGSRSSSPQISVHDMLSEGPVRVSARAVYELLEEEKLERAHEADRQAQVIAGRPLPSLIHDVPIIPAHPGMSSHLASHHGGMPSARLYETAPGGPIYPPPLNPVRSQIAMGTSPSGSHRSLSRGRQGEEDDETFTMPEGGWTWNAGRS